MASGTVNAAEDPWRHTFVYKAYTIAQMEEAKKKILFELGFTEHYPSILEKIEIVSAMQGISSEEKTKILNLLTGEDPQKRGEAAWKAMKKIPVDIDMDEKDEKAIILCYAYKKTLDDLFQN